MSKACNIHFLGAAGTVTGSKYLLKFPGKNILIDCGMFQGVKKLRELNWEYLPVKVEEIDLVLLTHGHMDHTGFLPRLVRMGYRGPIWGTPPTLNVAEIILQDSAKIQEEEAEKANKQGYSKHDPAEPLYNTKDVEETLPYFENKEEGNWVEIDSNIRVRFQYNGHILGATFIELDAFGKRFVFSGDVGRKNDPLLKDPKQPEKADILFIESTYGDRHHPDTDPDKKLSEIINQTLDNQGTLIIPSFAVERAQLLMYLLWQLREKEQIPSVPIIMDSPMGAKVLDLFSRHYEWHKLSRSECEEMCREVRVVESYEETWEIIEEDQPKIVIAGSGMVTGGRVLTYLQQYIDRPKTTVMLAGFQAEGTRGRQLMEGCKEIKFYGKYHPVKAKIESIQSLSAHADQTELLEWISTIIDKPEKVYITHGEPQASDMLRVKLKDEKDWDAIIPALFEIHEVSL
ncbi:MBL fold metallo-hydrolase [Balneolaceae bacterium YR4-1]|uniref:MBL fold metallo-hydrolase n=1 Tax=Halalkalibaculum roseum TaxID=2709311 RepID=A0A6M1SYV7_9BACT|nr:MBL fold metallo-hydrolase [Halalkalibaculum roseum]NGP77508.1 MBL fold metallo-hydrolase [Halalkalibaculum roseum]